MPSARRQRPALRKCDRYLREQARRVPCPRPQRTNTERVVTR